MKNFNGSVQVTVSKNAIARKLFEVIGGHQGAELAEDESVKAQLITELIVDKSSDRTLIKLWNASHGFTTKSLYSYGDYVLLKYLPENQLSPMSCYDWRTGVKEFVAQVDEQYDVEETELRVMLSYVANNYVITTKSVVIPIYDILDTTGVRIHNDYFNSLHDWVEERGNLEQI